MTTRKFRPTIDDPFTEIERLQNENEDLRQALAHTRAIADAERAARLRAEEAIRIAWIARASV